MSDDWKKSASLIVGTLSDAVKLVILTVVPTPATSINGEDKTRALHLSALVAITVLGIWLMRATKTAGGGAFEPLFFIALSIILFTVASWIMFGLLKLTGLYDPRGQTIIDALTLVIGFNLIATVSAVVITELAVLLRFDFDNSQLKTFVFWGALGVAILLVSTRILIKLPERSVSRVAKALSAVALLGIFAALYLNFLLGY
jgi:hypothetical protein